MTRKHYIAIAQTLIKYRYSEDVIKKFVLVFNTVFDNFDDEKFMDYIDKHRYKEF